MFSTTFPCRRAVESPKGGAKPTVRLNAGNSRSLHGNSQQSAFKGASGGYATIALARFRLRASVVSVVGGPGVPPGGSGTPLRSAGEI